MKNSFSVKSALPLKDAIARLEDLVAALKAGSVTLQRGDEGIVLTPQAHVEVEIEAEQKKGKESLQWSLCWNQQAPSNGQINWSISSTPPNNTTEMATNSELEKH